MLGLKAKLWTWRAPEVTDLRVQLCRSLAIWSAGAILAVLATKEDYYLILTVSRSLTHTDLQVPAGGTPHTPNQAVFFPTVCLVCD